MTQSPHPEWCTDGEAEPAATVHRGVERAAGKWRVDIFQVDTAAPGGPVVHLRHPDLIEEHGQMDGPESIALGMALIIQGLAALSNHTDLRQPHATRSSHSGTQPGGAA